MPASTRPSIKTKPLPKRSADLAEVAFQRLRQAILTGELKEGERVRETRLAGAWAIGITPLREAVRRMAAIGYLLLKPNHAPLVRKLSGKDIRQIYEIREVLECMALRSAWDTISQMDLGVLERTLAKVAAARTEKERLLAQFSFDDQLHHLWISSPGHPWLAVTLERLIIYRPDLASVMSTHSSYVEQAFEQHQQILEAIKQRSLKRTLHLLTHHIRQSAAILVAVTNH